MKANTRTCWTVLLLTFTTSVTPTHELAAGDLDGGVERPVRSSGPPEIYDVELSVGGKLDGQVLDGAGQPRAGQAIVVWQSGCEPVIARSDHAGRFRLDGIQTGVCRIECGEAVRACRCWSPSTAPPAATDQLLLIADESIERGQRCIGDLLSGPVLIGLIIAAAVVIPIAVHNSQNDAS